MARTYRIDNTRDGRTYEATTRRPYYSTESKVNRKATNGKVRRKAKIALARYDDDTVIPVVRGTGGWLTH